MTTAVYLEVGRKRVFACALEWPGWTRAGRTEHAALEALADYAERYVPVVEQAGLTFPADAGDALDVVELTPAVPAPSSACPTRCRTSTAGR